MHIYSVRVGSLITLCVICFLLPQETLEPTTRLRQGCCEPTSTRNIGRLFWSKTPGSLEDLRGVRVR